MFRHVPCLVVAGLLGLASGLPAQLPERPELEKQVLDTLDRFHRAAATADETTYFGLLTENAVFLGTDATERWTREELRAFAKPHFAKESAWVFRPVSQNVTVVGDFAWFDELLDSEHLGVCRGSGVMLRSGTGWKIGQYHLTVPIPNELVKGFVRRIRGQAEEVTRLVLVRHAEKTLDAVEDPPLTPEGRRRAEALREVLSDLPLAAVFTTPYRRNTQTAAPIAQAKRLDPVVVNARFVHEIVGRLKKDYRGRNVLYIGHSNTVPAVLQALGAKTSVRIEDDDYDDLFVVTLRNGTPPEVVHLHYRPQTPVPGSR